MVFRIILDMSVVAIFFQYPANMSSEMEKESIILFVKMLKI